MTDSHIAETKAGDCDNLSSEGWRARRHFHSGGFNQVSNDKNVGAAESGLKYSKVESKVSEEPLAGPALLVSPPSPPLLEEGEQILQRREIELSQYKQGNASLSEKLRQNRRSNNLLSQTRAGDTILSNRSCKNSCASDGSSELKKGEFGLQPELLNTHPPQTGTLNSDNSSSFFISDSVLGTITASRYFSWTESLELKKLKSEDSMYQPAALQVHPYEAYKDLRICAQCEVDDCDEDGCRQMKTLLSDVQECWRLPRQSLTSVHENLLVCMYEHCAACESLPCMMPWCYPQLCRRLPKTASREAMIELMQHGITNRLTVINAAEVGSFPSFVKFDPRVGFAHVPTENQAWTPLCLLGQFSRAVLVKPHRQFEMEPRQYWVLKKVTQHMPADSWDVYRRLAKLNDLNSLTPLLWAASMTDMQHHFVMTCSTLEGVSLHDHMQSCDYLTSDLIVRILAELLTALLHLHAVNIVYLNWTCKNILIHQNSTQDICVKLINFDSSAIVGKVKDAGLTLPVHLLPPELLSGGGPVELSSDVWGLGCLLYEMTTLHPVWHEHRHKPVEELKKLMTTQFHPAPPGFCHQRLRPLFEACWKVDPKNRVHIKDLQNLLSKM